MADSSSSPAPKRAAGIILVNPKGEALLLRRTDREGWAFPGGGIEDGETAEIAARRELEEETGLKYDGELSTWTRRVKDGVDFTTFIGKVGEPFVPVLNAEHDAHQWMGPTEGLALEDLHPGARIALAKFDLDELGIGKAIRDGELVSPQRYGNFLLVALRITGTGASYRPEIKEFVWRDPALYLNAEFLERCQGLPVVLDHPPKGALDSKEWAKRAVGTIFLPYIVGDEVWGVAKIYDAATIKLIVTQELSTSPMVECTGPKIKLEDGQHVLLEEKPELVDHCALCDVGVWDKGGPPSGVQSSTVTSPGDTHMAESAKTEEKKDAAKADATEGKEKSTDGEKLDSILEHVKGLHAKHDALCSRVDALEKTKEEEPAEHADEAEDKEEEHEERADAEGEEEGEESEEESLEEERGKNGLKKKDKKGKKDRAKKDAGKKDNEHADSIVVKTLREENAGMRARLDAIDQKIKDMPEDERSRYVAAQQRADRVAQAFGDSARRWLTGENLAQYRRALAQPFQKHSPSWKDIDLTTLPDNALEIAEKQIYADAWDAATKPSVLNAVEGLREVMEEDRTGRKISKFYGDPEEVWGAFKRPGIRARLNLHPRGA